jgi:hypothetical protein
MTPLAPATALALLAATAPAGDLPTCPETFLRDRSLAGPLGVDVTSRPTNPEQPPGHDWIGDRAATDGFHAWRPLALRKTTICGTLAAFGTFQGGGDNEVVRILLGDALPEVDWNLFLIPRPGTPFAQRFALARRFMIAGGDLGDLESCRKTGDCFEAEITAPAALRRLHSSPEWVNPEAIVGEELCVYGPWVGDSGHGHKPEVHPAERAWWADPDDPDAVFLALMQDASQRFVERGAYIRARSPFARPTGMQSLPWASATATEQSTFRVFFDLTPDHPSAALDLEYFGRRTRKVDPPGKWKVVSGEDVELGGPYSLRVQTRPSRLADARLAPPGMSYFACRAGQGADARVHGALILHQRVGCSGCPEEGYEAIKVSRDAASWPGDRSAGPGGTALRARRPTPAPIVLTSRLRVRDLGTRTVRAPETKAAEIRRALRAIDEGLDPVLRPEVELRRLLEGKDRMSRATRWDLEAAPNYVGAGERPERLSRLARSAKTRDARARFVDVLCQQAPPAHERESRRADRGTPFAVCAGRGAEAKEHDPFAFDWTWQVDAQGGRYLLDVTECVRDPDSPLCQVPLCDARASGSLEPVPGCPERHALLAVDEPRHKVVLLPSDPQNRGYRPEYDDHLYVMHFELRVRYTEQSGLPCVDPAAAKEAWQADWLCAGADQPEHSRTLSSHSLRPVDESALCGWLDGFLVGDHACPLEASSPADAHGALLSTREQEELVLQGLVQFRFYAGGRLSLETLNALLRAWSEAREGRLPARIDAVRRKAAPRMR